mmetsp:Transcript_82975/g.173729  ORF Transcript_82975/g.173729 Transcript_82975/m.173729 type:complete len:208 (+) Transcript_82975:128-751(+)
MNFVKAETLVQEITADGKVRDIVTERVKTAREKEEEEKEQRIRNLPEFKRLRNEDESKSLSEQIAAQAGTTEEEESSSKPKQYNVHQIDEDEFEHYQAIETAERDKKRQQLAEDKAAFADFESERKRFKADDRDEKLHQAMEQRRKELASRAKAAPTAQDRLRGRVMVKAKVSENSAGTGSQDPAAKAVAEGGGGGLLSGYASDSDE